jgi:hypothetical protein
MLTPGARHTRASSWRRLLEPRPTGAKRTGTFADETNRYRKYSDRPLSLGCDDENGRR